MLFVAGRCCFAAVFGDHLINVGIIRRLGGKSHIGSLVVYCHSFRGTGETVCVLPDGNAGAFQGISPGQDQGKAGGCRRKGGKAPGQGDLRTFRQLLFDGIGGQRGGRGDRIGPFPEGSEELFLIGVRNLQHDQPSFLSIDSGRCQWGCFRGHSPVRMDFSLESARLCLERRVFRFM